MKDDFNWHDQYTQSVINEMESEGLLVLTSKYLTKNTITEMLGEMK
jgi:hypothetical protein